MLLHLLLTQYAVPKKVNDIQIVNDVLFSFGTLKDFITCIPYSNLGM